MVLCAWTWELKNEGKYEGENTNKPGAPSALRRLSEAVKRGPKFPPADAGPSSAIANASESIYDFDLKKHGDLSVSGLLAFE